MMLTTNPAILTTLRRSPQLSFFSHCKSISEDEFSLSNTATVGYNLGRVARQPKIMAKQRRRERKTAMGSYNFGTGQITVSSHEKGNYKSFKKHLKKILYLYRGHSKIIVVVDNVRYHHAKLLKKWLLGKTCFGTGLFIAVFPGAEPYRKGMVVYEKKNNPQPVYPQHG